jgi:hypothetical protein
MRFLALTAAAAAILTASVAAQAQPAGRVHEDAPMSGPPAPAPAPPAKKKDPVICKHQEETGSRLGGKSVCMTKSQWDEQRADAQRNMMGAQATPH